MAARKTAASDANDVQVTLRLPAAWLEEAERIGRRGRLPLKRAYVIRAALRIGLDAFKAGRPVGWRP